MIVLFRFALPLIVVGLIVGLVLRRVLGRKRLPLTVIVATALPILVHAGYSVIWATRLADVATVATVFALLTLVLTSLLLWVGLRIVAAQPIWAFAVPLVATAVYLVARYFSLQLQLQAQGVLFDLIPMLVLLGTIIFVAAALLSYAPRIPQLRLPNLARLIRRR